MLLVFVSSATTEGQNIHVIGVLGKSSILYFHPIAPFLLMAESQKSNI
jgi:hypothetical protein